MGSVGKTHREDTHMSETQAFTRWTKAEEDELLADMASRPEGSPKSDVYQKWAEKRGVTQPAIIQKYRILTGESGLRRTYAPPAAYSRDSFERLYERFGADYLTELTIVITEVIEAQAEATAVRAEFEKKAVALQEQRDSALAELKSKHAAELEAALKDVSSAA